MRLIVVGFALSLGLPTLLVSQAGAGDKIDLFPDSAIKSTLDHKERSRHISPPTRDEQPYRNNYSGRAKDFIDNSPVGVIPQHDDPYGPTSYGPTYRKKF